MKKKLTLRNLRRTFQLLLGLTLMGIGINLSILAQVGFSPLDTLLDGLTKTFGLSFLQGEMVMTLFFLLPWAIFRKKPQLVTLFAPLYLGAVIDVAHRTLPITTLHTPLPALVLLTSGTISIAMGVVLYVRADVGLGVYEGMITHIAEKIGTFMRVKLVIEASIITVSVLVLGSVFSYGTVYTYVAINGFLGIFFALYDKLFPTKEPSPVVTPVKVSTPV